MLASLAPVVLVRFFRFKSRVFKQIFGRGLPLPVHSSFRFSLLDHMRLSSGSNCLNDGSALCIQVCLNAARCGSSIFARTSCKIPGGQLLRTKGCCDLLH